MRVRWIVPSQPTPVFQGGADLHFPGTTGWCWEEATWAGELVPVKDELLVTSLDSRQVTVDIPDVLVLAHETTASFMAEKIHTLPSSVKLLIRCVSTPSPDKSSEVWESLVPLLPKISSFAVLSDLELGPLKTWLSGSKFSGSLHKIPLGARCASSPGDLKKNGVAYVGRLIPEKHADLIFRAAERLPKIPFFFAAPASTELGALGKLIACAKQLPNVQVGTLGVHGRLKLLSDMRVVATATQADSQWLPGTEIRAAGGVALAAYDSLVRTWNGDGLAYHDGTVFDVAHQLERLHLDDAYFKAEAERQHSRFRAEEMTSEDIGRRLWQWVTGA